MADSVNPKRLHISVPGKMIDRIRVVLAGTGYDWRDYVRAAVRKQLQDDESRLKRELGTVPPPAGLPPPDPDDSDDGSYDEDQPVF